MIELISKHTRREFREWLVSWTLRTIGELFEDEEIQHHPIPSEKLPSGQRRGLVEEYYASINWSNPADVRKILNAYEHILRSIPPEFEDGKKRLIESIERDGYKVEGNRIIAKALGENLAGVISATERIDQSHLTAYIERIRTSIDTDPALAIGSTKELVEATLKSILRERGIQFDNKDDIPKLLKKVQSELNLDPAEVDEVKKGAETIKHILGSASTVVIGISELRNCIYSPEAKFARFCHCEEPFFRRRSNPA